MGGCGSKRGKVYASTEDPLLVEVRAKIAARDDCGKGMPVGKLNELLVDIGAEALDAAALDAAVKRLDAGGTGHVSADAFLNWFAASPDGGKPEREADILDNESHARYVVSTATSCTCEWVGGWMGAWA